MVSSLSSKASATPSGRPPAGWAVDKMNNETLFLSREEVASQKTNSADYMTFS